MSYRNKLISFLGELQGSPMAQDAAVKRSAEILQVTPRLLKAEVKAVLHTNAQEIEVVDVSKLGDRSAYEGEENAYWTETEPGVRWSRRQRVDYLLHLEVSEGLSRRALRNGGPSPAERGINWVQTHREFDVAIPLGGLPAGVHPLNGNRVLVPEKRMPMVGRAGNSAPVVNLIQTMLGRGRDTLWMVQWMLFVVWVKWFRESLNRYDLKHPRQLLGLIGPIGCGKTAVQSRVLTPLVGGRQADMGKYLSGRSEFNGGAWSADHIVLSDATLDPRPGMARRLRDNIKELVANLLYVYHPKGRTLRTLPHKFGVSLSANDDAVSAEIIPEIDDSTADKFSYLKCYSPETPFPNQSSPQGEAFWKAIDDSLPAFAYEIDNYVIPAEHADSRWGAKAWRHPEIMSLIEQSNPDAGLGGFIDSWLMMHPTPTVTGTAPTLFSSLHANDWVVFPTLCKSPLVLGQALHRLSSVSGWKGRITQEIVREGQNRQEKVFWTLAKPDTQGVEDVASA